MTTDDTRWSPFPETNTIGDAGRQPEIRSVPGPLSVGVADTALDFLDVGPFEIRACSSRGWSHRAAGTPRQDAFALLVTDDHVIVAVADGVSAGPQSQVAAEIAARSSAKIVADQMARAGAVDWDQVARRVSMRILDEAEYRQIVAAPVEGASLDDRLRACVEQMSTTLIVGVVARTPTSAGFATEIGVVAGDSAAYRRLDDRLEPVGGGKSGGSISSTAVRPLPGAVQPESVTLVLAPGHALVVGTDGIGDPVGDGTNDIGVELAHRWIEPPQIDEFLLDINFYRRTFDDDRTAVGLWVRPDAEVPDEPAVAEVPDEPAVAEDTDADVTDDAAGPDAIDEVQQALADWPVAEPVVVPGGAPAPRPAPASEDFPLTSANTTPTTERS